MISASELPEILTIPQVANYLKLSRTKTYRIVREGKLPHFHIDGNVRIRLADLREWIEDQVKAAA